MLLVCPAGLAPKVDTPEPYTMFPASWPVDRALFLRLRIAAAVLYVDEVV